MTRLFFVFLLFASSSVFAGQGKGYVNMLEVWSTGNVAFTIDPIDPTDPASYVVECNTQFILNVSKAGTKNQLATVLAAKSTGKIVRIYHSDTCVAADGYGGGNYIEPSYLYLEDN